jgi:hypothetical protein
LVNPDHHSAKKVVTSDHEIMENDMLCLNLVEIMGRTLEIEIKNLTFFG